MPRSAFSLALLLPLGGGTAVLLVGLLLAAALGPAAGACDSSPAVPGADVVLGPPGAGELAGATEYGGSGDPSSGVLGSSGADLRTHPDSYAELGGTSFATASRLGGLPYLTPLRITWQGRSAIARKRDIGLGGGPVDGRPRVIDLWWQFAGALGIPYEEGRWSGVVRLERTPETGSAALLGATPAPVGAPALTPASVASEASGPVPAVSAPVDCSTAEAAGVALSPGGRAELLADGRASAPAAAPKAVREIIAAGNAIAGRPYSYGAAHGVPLSFLAPAYDCSSSVEHLLYGARLLPVTDGESSSGLMSFGQPGAGRWVTLYASPDHVFMYVAGLRWDTWNAGGPADGSTGIGWHPLVRDAAGFVARHPVGL